MELDGHFFVRNGFAVGLHVFDVETDEVAGHL